MKQAGFRFLEHTADVQIESWGPTLEEAFSQTALSLMATITPNINIISPNIQKIMEII